MTLQLERRGIGEPIILDAFRAVAREQFVSPEFAEHAYADGPLPIGNGQTISQPYIVALMLQAAAIAPGQTILEVGAGSGYAAAVMSRIADKVIAIERQPELALAARERLHRLGIDNVELVEGDGTVGWPAEAPYDAILAAASGRHAPPALIEQLKAGGRLVMPIGPVGGSQELIRLTKHAEGRLEREQLGGVRFVPLIGAEGWDG